MRRPPRIRPPNDRRRCARPDRVADRRPARGCRRSGPAPEPGQRPRGGLRCRAGPAVRLAAQWRRRTGGGRGDGRALPCRGSQVRAPCRRDAASPPPALRRGEAHRRFPGRCARAAAVRWPDHLRHRFPPRLFQGPETDRARERISRTRLHRYPFPPHHRTTGVTHVGSLSPPRSRARRAGYPAAAAVGPADGRGHRIAEEPAGR